MPLTILDGYPIKRVKTIACHLKVNGNMQQVRGLPRHTGGGIMMNLIVHSASAVDLNLNPESPPRSVVSVPINLAYMILQEMCPNG